MHPYHHAAARPAHPAIVMAGSGLSMSYGELDAKSNQVAHLFRALGLKARDRVALQLENTLDYMAIVFGAQRCGLIYTPISTHLLRDEVAYIVNNCGARVFIGSAKIAKVAAEVREDAPAVETFLMLHEAIEGFDSFEDAIANQPTTPVADEEAGIQMLYSSGTTGRPKGVLSNRPTGTAIDDPLPLPLALVQAFGINEQSRYLSTAPLYHAAPLTFVTISLCLGATVVIMEKFDAENALKAIEQHAITHSQWVPIMFVRMLKLPHEVRERYSLDSLQVAIHAAAPCPVDVKHEMIKWFGPRIAEYYASTEGAGFTAIDSANWLTHPGSVGPPRSGQIHILDDDGNALPTGEVGTVYFSGNPTKFEYYDEPDKTAASYTDQGWATVGDVGYLDEDGFLYLTDRKHYMIISGGVNVYPQEVEDLLIVHEAVADAAVFGVPHPEFGEAVHAVVQLRDVEVVDDDMESRLIAYLRERLSHIKVPKAIDFSRQLPRHDNGKLYKRRLLETYRDRY
ncbi:MAG: acyl-CoA synthetase [Pseudomonadota bacterium]